MEKTLVAYKKLRYFPITPRLQRLLMSSRTTEHMTWHQSYDVVDGVMVHPSDSEAWKHFNSVHPHFSVESRNVRLELCTNGFNPFGSYVAPYSYWLVILMVYNLPSGMCMRPEFMFLFTVIPGPNSPGCNIVYKLSNTMTENLRTTRNVSTVGISQSVSSTQSQEFVALQQHTTHLTKKYEWLSADYEQLHQMVMDMRLQMVSTCAPPFWSYGPETDQPPPPPTLPLF